MKRFLITVLAGMALTLTAVPALAQENPEAEKAEFRFGFKALALTVPDVAGNPLQNERARANGDTHQMTTGGLMVWRKADNVPAFTNGATTWLLGPVGLQVRGNDDRFEWEKDVMAGGVKLRGDGTVDDNLPSHSGLDDVAGGVKLRGDGTVDDNLPSQSGLDDMVGGVKLRGDGTVDDNLPSHSGLDDAAGGVKLRGDGTVDDNSASQSSRAPEAERPGDDGSRPSGRSSGGSSGGSSGSGRGR